MDQLYFYIAGSGFLVFGFVGFMLWISTRRAQAKVSRGVYTYLKFIWANFLKPHDKRAEGQQDALESFYKTQVCKESLLSTKAELTCLGFCL